MYDGHEHGLFMDKLDARIRNHDREIEKMCNHHFQGFVDSITELLKVRGEAQKLKVKKDVKGRNRTVDSGNTLLLTLLLSSQSQVMDTNRHLQDDGKDVSQTLTFVYLLKLNSTLTFMFQLIGSMEELQKCRVQQRNIATTIDKLTHCLPGKSVERM